MKNKNKMTCGLKGHLFKKTSEKVSPKVRKVCNFCTRCGKICVRVKIAKAKAA